MNGLGCVPTNLNLRKQVACMGDRLSTPVEEGDESSDEKAVEGLWILKVRG